MNNKIYWIPGMEAGGLGIMARPQGGEYLQNELTELKGQGVGVLVSLLEEAEISELELREEGAFSQEQSIEYVNFPIADRAVPHSYNESWKLIQYLHKMMKAGKKVAIHCRMGIGRSSLIAAGVLVMDGREPGVSLGDVAKARGVEVPDTEEQKHWFLDFAAGLDDMLAAEGSSREVNSSEMDKLFADPDKKNILDNIPASSPEEITEVLAESGDFKIQRILSFSQASAPGFWYDQPDNEWVIVLKGEAGVLFQGEEKPRHLNAGDYLNIPARTRHRVEWTSKEGPTVWLAVHYK